MTDNLDSMSDRPAIDERPDKVSPWPLFIALGLAISEIGVLFGVSPLSVGGILLFGGSCAAIVAESGYATAPWRPLRLIGGVFSVSGGVLWGIGTRSWNSVSSVLQAPLVDGVAFRGVAILVAGVLLIAGSYLGQSGHLQRLRRRTN